MGCSGSKTTGTKSGKGPTLYYMFGSAPSRAVHMTAKAIGVDVNIKVVDLLKGEQKSDWYTKLNPNQEIPTLQDGSFILYESRAIMQYLVNKFAPGNTVYPSDPQQRALVERWLWWDFATIGKAIRPIFGPVAFKGESPDPEKEAELHKCFDYLDKELETKQYLTGDHVTIVDFSVIQYVNQLDAIDYDVSKWANLTSYKARMKELPYFAECSEGVEIMKQHIAERKAKQTETEQ